MRIGIDIGGMSIKMGLIDENKNIISKEVIPTQSDNLSAEQIIDNMANAVLKLLDNNHMTIEQCESLGIACPGTVDSRSGVVLYSNNIAWENIPILEIFRKKLPIPMFLANDADAAALAEVIAGAAKDKSNAVLVTLGTGVGGGVILEGKIFSGFLRGGSELGHTVIRHGGKLCTCGRKGCFECYASATALMELARDKALEFPDSLMNKMAAGNKIDGRIVFEAEKAGDLAAKEVVEQYEDDLSVGLVNIINIFRPEVVILGGGVSAQGKYLTDVLQEKAEKMCFGGSFGEVAKIVTSELKNDAGIIGAAYLS